MQKKIGGNRSKQPVVHIGCRMLFEIDKGLIDFGRIIEHFLDKRYFDVSNVDLAQRVLVLDVLFASAGEYEGLGAVKQLRFAWLNRNVSSRRRIIGRYLQRNIHDRSPQIERGERCHHVVVNRGPCQPFDHFDYFLRISSC